MKPETDFEREALHLWRLIGDSDVVLQISELGTPVPICQALQSTPCSTPEYWSGQKN